MEGYGKFKTKSNDLIRNQTLDLHFVKLKGIYMFHLLNGEIHTDLNDAMLQVACKITYFK
jgi:hypothetical protein